MGDKIKKIKRKMSKEIYLVAIFYTILLIAIGFILGFVYDKYLTDNISYDINVLSDFSFTSEILYALEGSEEFCDVYPYTIKRVEEQTWRIGVLIDQLENDNRLDKRLKQRYFDMELRDYFLTKQAQKRCNISSLTILYFYTNDRKLCPSCGAEGFELTIARNEMISKDIPVKIYAFDGEYGHEIVSYVKEKYNISTYPSLVIEYNNKTKVLSGFSDSNTIMKEINNLLSKPSFS